MKSNGTYEVRFGDTKSRLAIVGFQCEGWVLSYVHLERSKAEFISDYIFK